MINVFSLTNAAGADAGVLPAVAQSTRPVAAGTDVLLVFNVTTLTGGGTLQVIVEQLIAGQWVAVAGGTQATVSATGLVTYIVRGGFGSIASPWRIRVVPGGTVTAASFTLSADAAALPLF